MWSFFCIVPSFQGIYFDNLCQLCFHMSCRECVTSVRACVCLYLNLFAWIYRERVCENIASCDGTERWEKIKNKK